MAKKKKEKVDDQQENRLLTTVMMVQTYDTIKSVKLGFTDPNNTSKKKDKYGSQTTHPPHDDFKNAVNALTQHGLDYMEMNIAKHDLDQYCVSGVQIQGDITLNKAQVKLILNKVVHRAEAVVAWTTPQIMLNEKSKYLYWKDLKQKIEKVIEEAWAYVGGKQMVENGTPLAFQLEMFKEKEQEEPAPEMIAVKGGALKEKSKFTRAKKNEKKPIEQVFKSEPFITGPTAQA
jgi:hypothetical protein